MKTTAPRIRADSTPSSQPQHAPDVSLSLSLSLSHRHTHTHTHTHGLEDQWLQDTLKPFLNARHSYSGEPTLLHIRHIKPVDSIVIMIFTLIIHLICSVFVVSESHVLFPSF